MYSIARSPRCEGAHRALVLMEERDRIDQRQVLLVIAPQARASVGEGEPLGVRVQHLEGRSSRCAF